MSHTNIKLALKNDAKLIYTSLNKRTEFYLVVQNFESRYLPQVRVVLSGPPEIKLLIKLERYGGISRGGKKSRLFTIIPKSEGIFTLTALLYSGKYEMLTLPIEVRVGNLQAQHRPIIQQAIPEVKKQIKQINCPFCHEKIDDDAKFCSHCGSNLTEKENEKKKTKICYNCGQELPKEAKFCAKCGEKLI
ncbi:MAG: zinc ribbon domain-containing protein [Candidatus Hodarchaeota archaeon]